MIAKQVGNYEDFAMIQEMPESVRKRRSLTRFQQQEPELYEQYNLRYQLEQGEPDQKPKKGRKKAV